MKLSASAEKMEWKSMLALWPYACLAFTAIGVSCTSCFVNFDLLGDGLLSKGV
jgi:hypothetical protein